MCETGHEWSSELKQNVEFYVHHICKDPHHDAETCCGSPQRCKGLYFHVTLMCTQWSSEGNFVLVSGRQNDVMLTSGRLHVHVDMQATKQCISSNVVFFTSPCICVLMQKCYLALNNNMILCVLCRLVRN